ncbi:thap domain-containing protein 9 [Holotrichia oblita]|uniref:Thap domain-containing protein 9 n=1 Tax=Holotrichia oblita TaxID=644536 RepID=A0ACB9SU34_HOLOL|nr:thap domain-containing protein 9 [Holotrichia oblita]
MKYGDNDLILLLDTGASISVLFRNYIDKNEYIDYSQKVTINGISGKVTAKGLASISLNVDSEIDIQHNFWVTESLAKNVHVDFCFAMDSLEIDVDGLTADEVLYELSYRGIKGMEGKSDDELRCILRPLLKLERVNKTFSYPAYVVDPVEKLGTLDLKVVGLQLNVAALDTVDLPRAEQLKARVYHILNRINRIPTEGLTTDQSSKRSIMLAIALGQLDRLNTISSPESPLHDSTRNPEFPHFDFRPFLQSTQFPPPQRSMPVSKWQLKFSGDGKGMTVHSFLERANELRVARGLTTAQLFDSAIDLFEGKALLWFRSNKDVFTDWNSLSALLIKHYEPPDYRARLFEDILSRTQDPNESFIEYFSCMLSMFRRYGGMSNECQIRNANRKKKERSFTFEDKADAIALCKTSPRMYKLLGHLFALPSITTLQKVLTKISFKPGIHAAIFDILKNRFRNCPVTDRLCVLMFDEMAIQPHLEYSSYEDEVIGFENDGYTTTSKIAEHAMVFMLRGICTAWKQPVDYAYCKSSMSSATIVHFYKDIVMQAKRAGLILVASVCDQASTNVHAIEMLLEDTRRCRISKNLDMEDGVILVDDVHIVPLFDPPHLLKSIRNNLLTKDLSFYKENKKFIAKWDHIISAYTIDRSYNIGILKKLNDFHVIPNKIKKMKVSCCTQVFSKSVAAAFKLCAIFNAGDKTGSTVVPAEALDTCELISFLDQVFDSVNCTLTSSVAGKELKKAVSRHSSHAEFWRKSIDVFRSMEFVPRKSEDRKHPSVLKGWTRPLQGFLHIRRQLLSLGVVKFSSRAFNQDPIENFFC